MQNIHQKETYNFFSHFFRGAVHYSIGGSMSRFLVFINVIIILASVAPYQYGVYKLAFSVFLIVNGLLLSGMNGLVLNDVINYRMEGEIDKARRLFYEFIVVRLFLGFIALLVFYFGAGLIETNYSEGIATYLRIFSVLFVTDALVTIADVYFKSRLDFFGTNVIPFVSEFTKLLILLYFIVLAPEGLNILNLCFATVLGSLVSVVVISAYIWFKHSPSFAKMARTDSVLLWAMFKTYGKWGIAKNYVSTFVDNLRLWLVKIFISTEAVAIFSVAVSLATTIKKFIPTQSIVSLIPMYAKDPNTLKDVYMRATKYFIWIFVLTTIMSFMFVPLIVPIVFPKYVQSIPYFKIIVLTIVFSAMALNKQVVYSLRKQKFLFVLPFIELVSTLVFGVLLIPRFGLYGTAVEMLITEAVIFMVIYTYLIKIQPQLSFDWKRTFIFEKDDSVVLKSLWNKVASKLKLK